MANLPAYIVDRDNQIAKFGIKVEREIDQAHGEVVTRWYGTEDQIRASEYFPPSTRLPLRAGRLYARFALTSPQVEKHKNCYVFSHRDDLPGTIRTDAGIELYTYEAASYIAHYGAQEALLNAKIIEPRHVPSSGTKRCHSIKNVVDYDEAGCYVSYDIRRIYGEQKLFVGEVLNLL